MDNRAAGGFEAERPTNVFKRLAALFARKSVPERESTRDPSLAMKPSVERHATVAEKPANPLSSAEECLAALELELPAQSPLSQDDEFFVSEAVEQGLRHFQGQAHELRAQPVAALRVINLVAAQDVDVNELTRTINQDPAMSATILRVANSAGAGGAQAVRTVRDALVRLGASEVARLAGAVAARALFNPAAKAVYALYAPRFARLHSDAAISAAGSAQLCMDLRRGRSDMAYLAGMMHDVGKSIALSSIASLVLADKLPRELSDRVLDEAVERMHVEVGTEMHLEWSLPQYLTTLCSSFHDETLSEAAATDEMHVVRVVSSLVCLRSATPEARVLPELASATQALGMRGKALKVFDHDLTTLADKMREAVG